MEDYMLVEYLKNQGIGHNMSGEELLYKFKEFMNRGRRMRYESPEYDYNEKYDSKFFDYPYRDNTYKYPYNVTFNRYQGMPRNYRNHMEDTYNTHFSEHEAKAIVNDMYHYYNGKKVSGEIFSMDKARELCNTHKRTLYGDVDYTDIYVAINAQYHDYCSLFKTWFGNNIDNKIIESALLFWFKDDDYKKGSKVMHYFE